MTSAKVSKQHIAMMVFGLLFVLRAEKNNKIYQSLGYYGLSSPAKHILNISLSVWLKKNQQYKLKKYILIE